MRRFTILKAPLLATAAMTATAAAAQDGAGAANVAEVVAQGDDASKTNSAAADADRAVNAGIEIAGGYNENVYATRNRERDDFYLLAKPFVRADVGSSGTTATLRGEGDIARYAEQTSENYDDWLLGLDGRTRLDPGLSLIGGGDYRWAHESRSSPEAENGIEPTRYRRGLRLWGARRARAISAAPCRNDDAL